MKLELLQGAQEVAENQISPYQKAVQEYRQLYSGLTIAGIEDRDGYKAAQEAAKNVRSTRLDLQKESSAIVKAINGFKSKFQGHAKKVIGQFSELEEELRGEMARIDQEKAAEKERERLAELKRFTDRTDLLFEAGFTYDGYQYRAGAVFVVSGEIGDMPEEEFNAKVQEGREEAARLARLIEKAEAEKEREAVAEHTVIRKTWQGQSSPPPNLEPAQEQQREPAPQFSPPPSVSEMKADPDFRPPGFTAGFDACRNGVLAILDKKEKFTRTQLREMIQKLKP